MDTITLTNITVQALIGILPEEQTARQRLCVTVEMGTSLAKAGRSDKIEHTINYAEIEAAVLQLAEESHFNLIERFASEVAKLVLEQPLVKKATITVSKPDILKNTENVSVTITHKR